MNRLLGELVASDDMDLVVMGSVARGGIHGLVLGSTAQRVFDHISCSVVAVKPDDFMSLVEIEEQARATEGSTGWRRDNPR